MGFHFKSRTELGLKHLLRGMMLFGFLLVMVILVILSFFGFGLMTLIIGLTAFITLIATLISWFLGFLNMFRGRWEFGPIHNHCVNLSIMFAFLFIFIFVGQLGLTIFFPQIGFFSLMGFSIRVTLGILTSSAISLSWVFLIKELASPEIKTLLWISAGINIFLSTALSVVGLNSRFFTILGFTLWFFVIFLVIYCYQKIYDRIKKKEILPIFPPSFPPNVPPP